MSIKHLNWAFQQDLPSKQKLTLVALCDCLNADGEWHIKHDTLAEKTSLSRRSIIRHIAYLVEHGFITYVRTRHKDGKQGYNLYRVTMCHPEETRVTKQVSQSDKTCIPECQDVTAITTQYSPNTHPDNTVSEKPPVSDLEKAFQNWNIIAEACGLPKATKLPPARKQRLKARLAEVGLSGWNEALENLERAPWMHGDNDRGWRADFDFMLQPSSLMKLIEGAYLKADEQTH